MSRAGAQRVADMLMAADEIAAITDRGRPAFDNDVVLRRALERCFEILGEAAKAVTLEMQGAHPAVPWTAMAKIRDRLSHHYHRIDPSQLWTVAIVDIPSLAQQLRALERLE